MLVFDAFLYRPGRPPDRSGGHGINCIARRLKGKRG